MKRRAIGALVLLTVGVWLLGARPYARAAETRISIGVTETMETFNPYGDSVSLMYSVWCMVLGCLGTYDFDKGQHVGLLVESWEVKDPKTWLFHLRKSNRFHDGSPVTAEDVVWSLERAGDPKSGNPIQFVWGKIGNFKIDGNTITADVKEFEPALFKWMAFLTGYVLPLYSQVGRVAVWQAFGWYRLKLTIPAKVGALDTAASPPPARSAAPPGSLSATKASAPGSTRARSASPARRSPERTTSARSPTRTAARSRRPSPGTSWTRAGIR